MKHLVFLLTSLVTGVLLITGCQSTTAGGATRFLAKPVSADFFRRSQSECGNRLQTGAGQGTFREGPKHQYQRYKTGPEDFQTVDCPSRHIPAGRPEMELGSQCHRQQEVNAYCMPGGKIAVYSGIIRSLNLTDDELAAVIGHEMAHALREHSREQISQQVATEQALSIAGALAGFSSTQQSLAGKQANWF